MFLSKHTVRMEQSHVTDLIGLFDAFERERKQSMCRHLGTKTMSSMGYEAWLAPDPSPPKIHYSVVAQVSKLDQSCKPMLFECGTAS